MMIHPNDFNLCIPFLCASTKTLCCAVTCAMAAAKSQSGRENGRGKISLAPNLIVLWSFSNSEMVAEQHSDPSLIWLNKVLPEERPEGRGPVDISGRICHG